jgi:hypothetical protein
MMEEGRTAKHTLYIRKAETDTGRLRQPEESNQLHGDDLNISTNPDA